MRIRAHNDHSVNNLNKITDLLGLNPEFYTVWNIRREELVRLFESLQLDKKSTLEDELNFVMVLLKRFPKCYWIWNHRLWSLAQLGEDADWERELSTVSKLLSMDERNFHGWQYRRIVVLSLETNDNLVKDLLVNLNEFKFTTSKVNNNISNFSAWHNRSKLIPKIYSLIDKTKYDDEENHEAIELLKNKFNLLNHELNLVNTGMYVDIDDSSIWVYLNWLLNNEFFVSDLSQQQYDEILKHQFKIIEELNNLEKDDNGKDNCWCLKLLILIKALLNGNDKVPIILYYKTLIEIDPLRRGLYSDKILELECQ